MTVKWSCSSEIRRICFELSGVNRQPRFLLYGPTGGSFPVGKKNNILHCYYLKPSRCFRAIVQMLFVGNGNVRRGIPMRHEDMCDVHKRCITCLIVASQSRRDTRIIQLTAAQPWLSVCVGGGLLLACCLSAEREGETIWCRFPEPAARRTNAAVNRR